MTEAAMTTVIYSGSFDPVHRGHTALAAYVASMLGEESDVWLLVTPHNPLKPCKTRASFHHRMAMTRMALAGIPSARASDFEASLPPPHYTLSTLLALRSRYPEREFALLIGADNWEIFPSWHESAEILRQFRVFIYPRPGHPVDASALPPGVTLLADAPLCDISSTRIREELAAGRPADAMLPAGVADYIAQHNIYG